MKQLTGGQRFGICLILSVLALGLVYLRNSRELWLSGQQEEVAPSTSVEPEAGEAENEHPGHLSWFYAQRAYPRQELPPAARAQAFAQLELEEARLRQRGFNQVAEPLQQTAWQPLGPVPIEAGQTFGSPRVAVSGRVSTIALDPGYNGTSNQTVYLGAAQGGVWRSRDNGATWTPLTDDQPSLAMGAIAIDPTNPNIIYAGTGEGHRSGDSYYGAGLLKSTNGGATWMQITGPVSTTNPQRPAFINATFMDLAINPATPSTIYAATNVGFASIASTSTGVVPIGNRGIWKSMDAGLTWRNLNPANSEIDRSATDILLDPQNPERVFAAILNLGIYRSSAGGEAGSWQLLAGGLPDSGFTRVELAVGPPLAPSTNATLYAAFATTNDNLLGIYRSTDQGVAWTKVTTPQAPGQASYNLALAVDPVDANIVYYGTSANTVNTGGTLWRSRDGGQTWADLSAGNGSTGGLHADTHWIAISPANHDLLFTANDGGVWRTDNATANAVTWTNLNQALNLTQFQTIALHPTSANILLGGTQDNGTNRYDGSPSWFHARDGDGGFTLIDQANPQVVYHTFFNQNNEDGQRAQIGPEISLNGGNTWARRGCFSCSAQPGNFNPADRVSFYAPLAQHTAFTGASGNVIYLGTHRLYRSADQGVTWTGLGASTDGFGADLTKNIATAPSYITAIAAHPSLNQSLNPPGEIVWVGTGDGLVQLTTNAGALATASFTNVTRAPLPNRFVADIALDPNNQQRAIVTYSGFNTNTPGTPGHVFTTNNQGATWTDISGNLPDVPVNSVVLDPLRIGVLYIGTDIGVFQTADSGATWVRLANSLPNVAVLMLRYHAASRTLVAATHGRGVFRLTLPNGVVSVSAASFTGPTLASEAIVAAFGANLATTQAAASLPLPTELAGTRVMIRDSAGTERAAPLFFVAPTQINYQMPPGLANGLATVTVISGNGTVAFGTAQLDAVAPGLFAANANGQGVAAAVALRVKADGTQSYEPVAQFDNAQNRYVTRPLELGPEGEHVFLILFGTGLRYRSALANVNATLGGTATAVPYAGAQGELAGLDQVNLEIPRSLHGRGEVDALLTVEGKTTNAVRISVR